MEPNSSWKKNIALFLTGQTLSFFGSSLVQYALMWRLTLVTGSGTMMTIFILCGFVPAFLVSPFAGVWADRLNRKKLIIIADLSIAFVTLLLAFVYLSGIESFALVFVTAGLRAVGGAVHQPAVGAVLPQVVPADKLARVNGLFGGIQSAVMLVSPVVAGIALSLWPIELIFFADVLTAALAVFVLAAFVKIKPHEKAAKPQTVSFFTDMKLGFRYIRERKELTVFFALLAVFLVLIGPAAFLTPLQVKRSFGPDVWRLTAIEIVFSSGMLAGGGIIALWSGFKNRIRTMAAAGLVMACCTVLLGVMPDFWLYLAPMAVFGLVMPFFNTGATVLLQERVEEMFLGRVFSVFTMLMTSMMPLGMLLYGPLAEVVPIEWLLIGTGALMIAGAVALLGSRRLARFGAPVAAEGGTPPPAP